MATGARALKSLVRKSVSDAAFDLLGESDTEFDEDTEIVNFKGSVIIDINGLANPESYILKDEFIEETNKELAITL